MKNTFAAAGERVVTLRVVLKTYSSYLSCDIILRPTTRIAGLPRLELIRT
jgi:hypothetical protein